MKRFIKIILSLIILLSLLGCTGISQASYTYDNLDTLIELIAEQDSRMDAAHQMADAARQLDYSEEHDIIKYAKDEWHIAYEKKNNYEDIYSDLIIKYWQQKEKEYPVATYIWRYFKELGYSDQVCAGILGNIMCEVGGGTLNIKYDAKSSYYYGMCQWSKAYSDVWGTSLEEQCDYLINTIQYELDTYGYAYKKGFSYNSFITLESEKDVALAFAKCYERCASGSYSARQKCATIAYNYFVN